MSEAIRVAVVGLGIGQQHLKAFAELPDLFEIAAVCDVDEARAVSAAESFRVPRHTTSLGELCRLDHLEVIDLCTPPYLHYQQLRDILQSGKHAICEKPLVGSLAELDELARLEGESGKHIMPIFQYRFGHGLQKLRFLVEHGASGRAFTTTVETSWRRRRRYYQIPWHGRRQTELGGALISHALHAHDMLTYILGPARRASAFITTLVNPIEVEDCAAAALEMADGSLASLSVTLGSAAEISRHRFCFEHLTAESGTAPYSSSSEPWIITPDSSAAARHIDSVLSDFRPLPEGYKGQFFRYHRALRQGGELPVTLADARTALELATALYYAAESGCAVTLPLPKNQPHYRGWPPQAGKEFP